MKNWLLAIREKYGLTQEWFANYLATSQTAIALAEQNNRELSTQAMLLLAPFLVENSTQPINSNIEAQLLAHQTEATILNLQAGAKRQATYQIKLVRLRNTLNSMLQKEQQALDCIALASRLEEASTGTYLNPEKKSASITQLLSSAFVLLAENGLEAQEEVLEKIKMYEAVVVK
jgi:transcriptional regulator with XRE-family HTH domain